jgi:hypothetical protein
VRLGSSFRDPAGHIEIVDRVLVRRVAEEYSATLDLLMHSGLYDELVARRLLVPHEEVSLGSGNSGRYLQPEFVETISYPYEWCFSQIKDAALATLEIQRLAIAKGLSLKDASAYNIQFHKGHAVLIDTLSFERYGEGSPWAAYRQFCEHFLAPLVLMSHVDARLGSLLRNYIDGIPLSLASEILPFKTRLSPGLSMHLHLHARAQSAAGDTAKTTTASFSRVAMQGLIDSLQSTIQKLEWTVPKTVWGDYYQNTNYAAESMSAKQSLVAELLSGIEPAPLSLWDLGANTGEFSRIASAKGIRTVAWDFDIAAVEQAYRGSDRDPLFLPLLVDLTNPSPRLGWAHGERDSFADRCNADVVMALALIHHLAIGNNVPLDMIADFFTSLSGWLLIEFVPKEDSQVQRLLAARNDPFDAYTQEGFESAFARQFSIVEQRTIPGTSRTLYLMRRAIGR